MTAGSSDPGPIDGILLVDKPEGPTSHDVVGVVRRSVGQKRVGHAGTLDPAASGLLVLLLGRATRLADAHSGAVKRYEVVVELGTSTATGDREGEVTATAEVPDLGRDVVDRAVAALVGERTHTPPAYSAVKVSGRPLYALARAGAVLPDVKSRVITVLEARLVGWESPRISIELAVSKGTYVRVLAEELGGSLGLPAHVAALRRTGSGPFEVAEAMKLEEIRTGGRDAVLAALVDPVRHALGLARARVSAGSLDDVRSGRPLSEDELTWIDAPDDDVLLIAEGRIVAWYRMKEGAFVPRAVLIAGAGGAA